MTNDTIMLQQGPFTQTAGPKVIVVYQGYLQFQTHLTEENLRDQKNSKRIHFLVTFMI